MTTLNQLTLCIITYKRPSLLNLCLESILKANNKPQYIYIIDNDPNKSAKPVFNRFKTKLPVSYYLEKTKGAPAARNKALSLCQTKFLAFTDDDCTLDPDWFTRALNAIQKPSHPIFVIGKSLLANPESLWAQAQFHNYSTWFKTQLKPNQKVTPEAIDTKNIIFNFQKLKTTGLHFDHRFSQTSIAGFEDVDFGIALYSLGFFGTYEQKMILYHREPIKPLACLKKYLQRGQLKSLLDQKTERFYSPTIPIVAVISLFGKFFLDLLRILKNKLVSPGIKTKLEVLILAATLNLSFKLGYLFPPSSDSKR